MPRHEDFANALVAQLPALRRYAVALTGNGALADDLVQDSIEKALRQSEQLRELPLLPRWLRRILHNLYIDDIRRRRGKGPEQNIMDLADNTALSVAPATGDEARDFQRAMDALAVEQREILLLAGLEELSYREIAEELDIPIGTVMSRLARARERLRGLMERDGGNVISMTSVVKARR